MKKILLFILFTFASVSPLFAQNFSGFNNGNYAGVSGVMLQPASIVDSRHKFDINLFSTDVRYSNNYFLLNRNVLLKFNTKNFGDYQTFRSKYLSEASLPAGEKVFFNISNRTQLPLSFMATLSNKSALALNFQSRTMVQGRNISQEVAQLAFNNFYHPPLNNRSLDASGISLRSLNWAEVGLTYGHVLFNSGHHFLKGAVTAKYLAGVSSLNLFTNDLRMGVNSDSTFNFTGNNISYSHNANADFSKVVDKRFRADANALGVDAGLVYEYRGQLDNFKYIRNDDEQSHEVSRRDVNKYIFRLGVSVLDAGMFIFDKPTNVSSFGAAINQWDIRNGNYTSLQEFDTALANRTMRLPNDPRSYNMYLPGALSVQLDIRFVKGLFLNATAYRPLQMGDKEGYRFNNYGYYSVTPRYERRHFGIYVPYTFSDKEEITNYRDNWLGLSLRLGPLFLGSNNLGTMAFNQKLKAADVFVGLKVGFTYGKPSKVERFVTEHKATREPDYERLVREKEALEKEIAAMVGGDIQRSNRAVVRPDTISTNRMMIDYMKGQVYANDKTQPVIIINNNYYYGNTAPAVTDSVYTNNTISSSTLQQNKERADSVAIINAARKQRSDSVNRLLNDSLSQKRQQVDSLIDRLYNLRQRMDSAANTNDPTGFAPAQKRAVQIDPDSVIMATAIDEAGDSSRSGLVAVDTVVKSNDVAVANRRVAQQQSLASAQEYEAYRQVTERLQGDIVRLERQLAYNRAEANAYRPAAYPQPLQSNPTPVYIPSPINTSQPPANNVYVPQNVASGGNKKDTVFIRDTVYVAKVDTVTKRVVAKPDAGFLVYPRDTVVVEKRDYSHLPPENILFATGEAAIRKVYIDKLNYLATLLRQHPELTIAIAGHTDNTGSAAANELLSLKRANAVKTYFLQKGIAANRMQLSAVADDDPLIAGNTVSAKTQNRRVEVRILQ